MWLTIAEAFFKVIGLTSWFKDWLVNRDKEKQITEEENAYKNEAQTFAAPARPLPDVLDAMRSDETK